MAEYQNIFTRIQVRAPASPGIPTDTSEVERQGKPFFNWLAGLIGNAQIGPIYLGWFGISSLICGLLAFEIIGLNMLASVDWDPVQFVRQLFWLALEPPPPEYGARHPAAERRWLVADRRLLPDRFDHPVVGADLPTCAGARHGYARRVGVRVGDLAVPGAGLHPPAARGKLE
jgi:hypothetical protein